MVSCRHIYSIKPRSLIPVTAFTRRQSDGFSSTSSSSIDSLESSSDLEKGRPYNISPSVTHTSDAPASTNSTFTNRLISDATIGLSDGLTVPFALTAGLSALGSSRVVVYGGLAELIAGAISMGLGVGTASQPYSRHPMLTLLVGISRCKERSVRIPSSARSTLSRQ
jgi:hypothetical protein